MRFVLLLLAFPLCAGTESGQDVLERLRSHVRQQINQVANYTCVQSVDRSYFLEAYRNTPGCSNGGPKPNRLYMRDRLRLDVAVSEGREIFSWHGGKNFSSKGVGDVVRSGPISSGSFVGYLRNIFFSDGVKIRLAGYMAVSGQESYVFDYVVPRESSRYRITNGEQSWTVPFHGRFTGSGTTYELISLQVIADEVPPESGICSAGSQINYQLVNISGKLSLIPQTYMLNVSNDSSLQTISRSEYTQCREFRGESTLSFDVKDEAEAQQSLAIHDEWMPPGITLHIRLRTPVDDRTSFMGDPVEATLIDPVKVKRLGVTIPKDAVLQGVITKLEVYEEPFRHYLASIHFQRLTFGANSFLMDADPVSSSSDSKWLAEAYHERIPSNIAAGLESGLFVWTSRHVHKDQHFTAEWKTKSPATNSPE